jgi:hypothetical protein
VDEPLALAADENRQVEEVGTSAFASREKERRA